MGLKEMVENELGVTVDEQAFIVAKGKAVAKQNRIFNQTKNRLVKTNEYLAQLVKEAIIEDAFYRMSFMVGAING